MTKPFSPSELVARVKAHMDRYNRLIGSNVRKNDIVEIRGIKIDKTARRVWVNGDEKTFTSEQSVYQGRVVPGNLGYGICGRYCNSHCPYQEDPGEN